MRPNYISRIKDQSKVSRHIKSHRTTVFNRSRKDVLNYPYYNSRKIGSSINRLFPVDGLHFCKERNKERKVQVDELKLEFKEIFGYQLDNFNLKSEISNNILEIESTFVPRTSDLNLANFNTIYTSCLDFINQLGTKLPIPTQKTPLLNSLPDIETDSFSLLKEDWVSSNSYGSNEFVNKTDLATLFQALILFQTDVTQPVVANIFSSLQGLDNQNFNSCLESRLVHILITNKFIGKESVFIFLRFVWDEMDRNRARDLSLTDRTIYTLPSVNPNFDPDSVKLIFLTSLVLHSFTVSTSTSKNLVDLWLHKLAHLLNLDNLSNLPNKYKLSLLHNVSIAKPQLLVYYYSKFYPSAGGVAALDILLDTYFQANAHYTKSMEEGNGNSSGGGILETFKLNQLKSNLQFTIDSILDSQTQLNAPKVSVNLANKLLRYLIDEYSNYDLQFKVQQIEIWIQKCMQHKTHPSSYYLNTTMLQFLRLGKGYQGYQIFETIRKNQTGPHGYQQVSTIDPRCYVTAANSLIGSDTAPEVISPKLHNLTLDFTNLNQASQLNFSTNHFNWIQNQFKLPDGTKFMTNTRDLTYMYNTLLKFALGTRKRSLTKNLLSYYLPLYSYHHHHSHSDNTSSLDGVQWDRVTYHMLIREASQLNHLPQLESLLEALHLEGKYQLTTHTHYYVLRTYLESRLYHKAKDYLVRMDKEVGTLPSTVLELFSRMYKPDSEEE